MVESEMLELEQKIGDLAARLRVEVLQPMKQRLIGKDEIIELMGVALVAGENLFLLGPPGTAKSALVHEMSRRVSGQSFDYLLTRFTEPSELFGPFDIRRLREGDLVTNTDGMLPEADFVFLDELLNANSAILNSLLMALNERVFRRGRETLPLPLLLVIAASNRLPEDEALAALFDRFLLRVTCDNVPDDRLSDVLLAGWQRELSQPKSSAGLNPESIRELQAAVGNVDLRPANEAFVTLVLRLRTTGFEISDRRAVKLQRVVAASAIMSGRGAALPSDLWVLRYIWDTRAQQESLQSHVAAVIDRFTSDDHPTLPHPLAQSESQPDPESMAGELRRLDQILSGDGSEVEQSIASDQLSRLAQRVQWVSNETARDELQGQIERLLQR